MSNQSPNRLRRAVIAFGVAGVVVLAALVGNDLFSNGPDTVPRAQVHAPEKPQPLGQTDQQKAEAALGPFETLAVPSSDHPDTQYPAVLLLRQDGSVAASQKWTLAFTPTSWAKQDVFQISKQMVSDNYVTLESATGRVYTVRLGQPFLLEGVPQQILLVDRTGQQWSAPTSRAVLLRRSL